MADEIRPSDETGGLPSIPRAADSPHRGEEEIHHPDGRIDHPQVHFERTDVSFRWIVGTILGAIVFAAAVLYVILIFFNWNRNQQSALKKSPFPLAPTPSQLLPAGPRLEEIDRARGIESDHVLARQIAGEALLHRYGSTTEDGYIHIPIDEALKLTANKLPSRQKQPVDRKKGNGLVDAGEPNSGRLLREESP